MALGSTWSLPNVPKPIAGICAPLRSTVIYGVFNGLCVSMISLLSARIVISGTVHILPAGTIHAIREIRSIYIVLRRIFDYHGRMAIIGISLQFHDSFDAQVARGIIEYAKRKGGWSLRGSGGGLRPLKFTGKDRCDAVIARIETSED